MTEPRSLPSAAIVGAATTGALLLYTAVHDATDRDLVIAGFGSVDAWKAAFATVAVTLLAAHLGSGMTLARAADRDATPPAWYPELHVLLGTLGVGLSLPVAFHDLWSLGFDQSGAAAFVRTVAVSAAYGGYAAGLVAGRAGRAPIGLTAATVAAFLAWWITGSWWTA